MGYNWFLFLKDIFFRIRQPVQDYCPDNKVIIMETKSLIFFQLILKITSWVHSWLTFNAFIFKSWQRDGSLFFHKQFPGFCVFFSWSFPAWNVGRCPTGGWFPRQSFMFHSFIINLRWGSFPVHFQLSFSQTLNISPLPFCHGLHSIFIN